MKSGYTFTYSAARRFGGINTYTITATPTDAGHDRTAHFLHRPVRRVIARRDRCSADRQQHADQLVALHGRGGRSFFLPALFS